MSSKQLNFFIVSEDLLAIFYFFEQSNILYIDRRYLEHREINLKSFSTLYEGPMDLLFLTSSEFEKEIYLSAEGSPNLYGLDWHRSSMIQFSPGGIHPALPNELKRGRLYSSMSYYSSSGELIKRSDPFKAWVQNIYKRFKKNLLEPAIDSKASFIYASPNCNKWMKDNNGHLDAGEVNIIVTGVDENKIP